jgi:hypothetical protein
MPGCPFSKGAAPIPVAKKTHFDPNWSIDRKCQLVYKFINRGWLNAVAWEYVPKILGRETEVTS